MLMSRSSTLLRLIAAAALLAFGATEALALPAIRPPLPPGVALKKPPTGNKGKSKKPAGPLEAALKDLRAAETDLESADTAKAGQMTRSAEQIVATQSQLAHKARSQAAENGNATREQKDQLKARVTALDAVLKDVRSAGKEIAARKTDDAKASVKAAIAGLEGLTGHEPKKKKKK
jgi:hypothetical protein